MSISDRYRQLIDETRTCYLTLPEETDISGRARRIAGLALEQLEELSDQVGDIPRIRLESQLTPVLLKAHNQIDRARLLYEEEENPAADALWTLQQAIYRLLNDL